MGFPSLALRAELVETVGENPCDMRLVERDSAEARDSLATRLRAWVDARRATQPR